MPKRYKVLITGSSGMLGIDLSKELHRDYEVIGFDLARNPKSDVSKFYKGDIADGEAVGAVFKRAKPDFVIHAAAWTDVDGCELDKGRAYRVNSEGTGNVANACKAIDATLIYISTDFVFNGKSGRPYKETDKVHPISVYGGSKLKGEKLVRKILKRYFIVRTSWLYGKCGKNFVDTIVNKAKTESSLKVVRDQSGSPTYTKYLAKALHALLDKACLQEPAGAGAFGIYHVSNTGKVSWYDYARKILALAGARTKVLPITSEDLARPARRPRMSVMDNSKFVKFTGYKMPVWNIALREYLRKK